MEAALTTLQQQLSTETKGKLGITFYPNPSNGLVYFSGITSSNATISLLDVSGKIIFKGSIGSDQNVDLTGISSGLYLIKISDNNTSSIQKIVLK